MVRFRSRSSLSNANKARILEEAADAQGQAVVAIHALAAQRAGHEAAKAERRRRAEKTDEVAGKITDIVQAVLPVELEDDKGRKTGSKEFETKKGTVTFAAYDMNPTSGKSVAFIAAEDRQLGIKKSIEVVYAYFGEQAGYDITYTIQSADAGPGEYLDKFSTLRGGDFHGDFAGMDLPDVCLQQALDAQKEAAEPLEHS